MRLLLYSLASTACSIAAVTCSCTGPGGDSATKYDSATIAAATSSYRNFFGDIANEASSLPALRNDYDRYALLGICAELAYNSGAATGEAADMERDSLLTERLNAFGARALTTSSADPTERLVATFIDNACRNTRGFKARAFRVDGDNGGYILSFAGTEPESADIITDIDGAFSIDEPQNEAAIKLTRAIMEVTGGEKLQLSGHSLGGRLASVCSILYGLDAVVYNPANIPIDLHKRMEAEKELATAANVHLERIHSTGDELTGGVKLGNELRPYIPLVSAMIENGQEWLSDTTSMSTVKSVISAVPEIAGAADAVLGIFGLGSAKSATKTSKGSGESTTRIALALLGNMRRYNVNAEDLENPLFYRYAGREVKPTPGTGGHSISRLNDQIDSIAQFIRIVDTTSRR